jgi:hypothetical protein
LSKTAKEIASACPQAARLLTDLPKAINGNSANPEPMGSSATTYLRKIITGRFGFLTRL